MAIFSVKVRKEGIILRWESHDNLDCLRCDALVSVLILSKSNRLKMSLDTILRKIRCTARYKHYITLRKLLSDIYFQLTESTSSQ